MRIARVLSRLDAGDTARQVLVSDPLLVERGHEVVLCTGPLTAESDELGDALVSGGVQLVRLAELAGAPDSIRWGAASRRLRGLFAEREPDVVHSHGPDGVRVAHRALAHSPRVARVDALHVPERGGAPEPRHSLFQRVRVARSARAADRVVADSHATAEELLRLGLAHEEQVVVVPPGAHLTELLRLDARAADSRGPLRRALGVGVEAYLVGVFGPLAEHGRSELALESFDLLAARHPGLQLVFLGDGPARGSLERLAAERGGRVHVAQGAQPGPTGGGPPSDVCSVFGDLDAVLHTARGAALPLALIEAAAAGRPVVCADRRGLAELVVHERTGLVGADATELAAGLDQLLADPRAGLAMGQRARLRVAERHGARRLTDRLEALYETVREARACAS